MWPSGVESTDTGQDTSHELSRVFWLAETARGYGRSRGRACSFGNTGTSLVVVEGLVTCLLDKVVTLCGDEVTVDHFTHQLGQGRAWRPAQSLPSL